MKIVTVVGARPQFVKASSVTRALRERRTSISEAMVHTGQHYDESMSKTFFTELQIPQPAYNLGVGSASHAVQTGKILEALDPVLDEVDPDAVLVYGDTNSTLAGALAAAKRCVPVFHVEAGLRSFDRCMPEEINRVLTDRLSALLFCPSDVAAINLRNEGITQGVRVIGDVMRDVLEWRSEQIRLQAPPLPFAASTGDYAVATIHRAATVDDPGRRGEVFEALRQVAANGLPVIFPIHPRTAAVTDVDRDLAGVTVCEPLPYDEMVHLLTGARVLLTDSGGLQKEAYWLRVPCVTLRDETEWVETVEAGWNSLVGTVTERIVAAALQASPGRGEPDAYGAAGACHRMIDVIESWA
jgi:UDP-GlcNAc3NAcA epimerase